MIFERSAIGIIAKAMMAAVALGPGILSAPAYAQSERNVPAAAVAGAYYQPPVANAPRARVGGASRGAGSVSVRLAVLAPDHVGYTSREQPTLYWYLSEPVAARIQITLTTEDAVAPVLEQTLTA